MTKTTLSTHTAVASLTPESFLRRVTSLTSISRQRSLFIEFCEKTDIPTFLQAIEDHKESYMPLSNIVATLSEEQVFALVFFTNNEHLTIKCQLLSLLCELKLDKHLIAACWEKCSASRQVKIIQDLLSRKYYTPIAIILKDVERLTTFLAHEQVTDTERKALMSMLLGNNSAYFKCLCSNIHDVVKIYHVLLVHSDINISQKFLQYVMTLFHQFIQNNREDSTNPLDQRLASILESLDSSLPRLKEGRENWCLEALLEEVFFVVPALLATRDLPPYSFSNNSMPVNPIKPRPEQTSTSSSQITPSVMLTTEERAATMPQQNMMLFAPLPSGSQAAPALIHPHSLTLTSHYTMPNAIPSANFPGAVMVNSTTYGSFPPQQAEAPTKKRKNPNTSSEQKKRPG